MLKVYQYVGPAEIRKRASHAPPGVKIESVTDLSEWMHATGQRANASGLVPITFVIDQEGLLRVADRGSEHIACSAGKPVLSAGEMFCKVTANGPELVEVSNLSTGFCPEPTSWPAVAAALDRLDIRHPGRFTQEVTFRRCKACGERNLVKDDWFTCGSCGANLPREWNF